MNDARNVFEGLMRASGHTDFSRKKEGYAKPALQTRWRYFLLGWEMARAVGAQP